MQIFDVFWIVSLIKLSHQLYFSKYETPWHAFDGTVKIIFFVIAQHIDGLVQERRNSIAKALELHLSCTNPSTHSVDISIS